MSDVVDSFSMAQYRLPRTLEVIQAGIERGLHYGVQLFVSQDLEPAVDLAVGENQPGEPLTSEIGRAHV